MTRRRWSRRTTASARNLFGHVLRGRLMRVVPRENEAINETWIADRDRFSYEGVYSADRLPTPHGARGDGELARDATGRARSTQRRPKACSDARRRQLGVLAQPLEHARGAVPARRAWRAGSGSANIDHRLRQRDFRDQAADPLFPGLGMPHRRGRHADALLVIGANLRREVPILAHRVRKAARSAARRSRSLNPARFDVPVPGEPRTLTAPPARPGRRISPRCWRRAAQAAGQPLPAHLAAAAGGRARRPTRTARSPQALASGERRAVWLGALAARHSALRRPARARRGARRS